MTASRSCMFLLTICESKSSEILIIERNILTGKYLYSVNGSLYKKIYCTVYSFLPLYFRRRVSQKGMIIFGGQDKSSLKGVNNVCFKPITCLY